MQSLESFYEDRRRRESRELHFGIGWRTPRYEFFEFSLFWLAETQELCALRAPIRDVQADGVFRRFILGLPQHMRKEELREEEVEVEVVAVLPEAKLQRLLVGWQSQVADPAGFDWVRQQLAITERDEA